MAADCGVSPASVRTAATAASSGTSYAFRPSFFAILGGGPVRFVGLPELTNLPFVPRFAFATFSPPELPVRAVPPGAVDGQGSTAESATSRHFCRGRHFTPFGIVTSASTIVLVD